MATAERPEVLLLSLNMESFLDQMYSSLFDKLGTSATLKRAKSPAGAIRYLEANTPKVILATDSGLKNAENRSVLEKVQSYLRNGGLLIFGLHFSTFINMQEFDKFFTESFGVSWTRGDYHRADFQFNPGCSLPSNIDKDAFPSPFSMKALQVKNARQDEKIFVHVPGGTTQSHVFPPSSADQTQAAVVGAKVGNGFLVYVGDVNAESGADQVILALCGL